MNAAYDSFLGDIDNIPDVSCKALELTRHNNARLCFALRIPFNSFPV